MKKLVTVILLFPLVAIAQDSARFVGKGLICGKGTLAAGIPFGYNETNMYVSGNLEYYCDNNSSYRGGVYIFLGASRPKSDVILTQNSTVFFGYNYHFKTYNHFDPYLGFQPGISWTQLKAPDNLLTANPQFSISKYPSSVSPVASVTLGINYYASKFTHLFIEATYVDGVHVSDISAVSLSELRIAFGFGFNLWLIKGKNKW